MRLAREWLLLAWQPTERKLVGILTITAGAMEKRSRLLTVFIVGFFALSSIAGYKVYSAFYNHIMERSETWHLKVEEVKGTHPLRLRISTETNQSAPVIRAITIKEHGTSVTVLYHLAMAGLAKSKLAWGEEYVLAVPDSVTDVRFGRHAEVIWQRSKSELDRK